MYKKSQKALWRKFIVSSCHVKRFFVLKLAQKANNGKVRAEETCCEVTVANALSQRHIWRFYTPIAVNLIASENRKRFSPAIDADTPGDFFCRSRRCGSFEKSCDKIAQPDRLALLAIRSINPRKSRKRAHLANLFADTDLISQMLAILYADRGDQRKSQSLHRAHLAIFAYRCHRRIKSPSVSLALQSAFNS